MDTLIIASSQLRRSTFEQAEALFRPTINFPGNWGGPFAFANGDTEEVLIPLKSELRRLSQMGEIERLEIVLLGNADSESLPDYIRKIKSNSARLEEVENYLVVAAHKMHKLLDKHEYSVKFHDVLAIANEKPGKIRIVRDAAH